MCTFHDVKFHSNYVYTVAVVQTSMRIRITQRVNKEHRGGMLVKGQGLAVEVPWVVHLPKFHIGASKLQPEGQIQLWPGFVD